MSSQTQNFSATAEPVANDPLHDVDAIARRLNVSTKFVRRRIDGGELEYYQLGRLLRISERQLQKYLAACSGRPER
jgi:excisionase family DNA binding protein